MESPNYVPSYDLKLKLYSAFVYIIKQIRSTTHDTSKRVLNDRFIYLFADEVKVILSDDRCCRTHVKIKNTINYFE